MAASIAFFLFAETSINERADCLYICSTCAVDIVHLLMQVREIEQILQLIDDYEKFVEKSELKSLGMRCKLIHKRVLLLFLFEIELSGLHFQAEYHEMNEQIEQMSKLAYLTLVKLTCAGTQLPIVAASVFKYLYYGMGEDSFLLPFYVLYESQ